MSSNEVDSQELDFEDIVEHFERKFKTSHNEKNPPGKPITEDSGQAGYNIVMEMGDLEPDLQILCDALMEHISLSNRMSKNVAIHDYLGTSQTKVDSGVVREVFRAEIKATLTQMKNFRESELESSEMLSGADRATINSLKRQVRERDEELTAVKQELKQAQVAKYRLEDSVRGYEVVNREYEDANELLENEIGELREQLSTVTQRCSDADVRHRRDQHQIERLNETLTQFRREVLLAHQRAQSARTEAKHATKRTEHLEARAVEARASSAAVSLRIKELKEIQDQMIAIMRGIQESGDSTAARRVLENLAEQRSRLVGRIANLLTRKKKQGDSSPRGAHKSQTSKRSGNSGERTTVSQKNPSAAVNNSSSPSGNTNHQNSDGDGVNRKQRFESFRRIGSELTKITTGRRSRRAVMENFEKTCEAVERDTDTLRGVIEMKDKELNRMEEKLAEAVDYAEILEKTLEKERLKKKLENRNMRDTAMDAAIAEMRSFTTTRRRSTLFEWQNQRVEKEGNEAKSGSEAKVSSAMKAVNSKVLAI